MRRRLRMMIVAAGRIMIGGRGWVVVLVVYRWWLLPGEGDKDDDHDNDNNDNNIKVCHFVVIIVDIVL